MEVASPKDANEGDRAYIDQRTARYQLNQCWDGSIKLVRAPPETQNTRKMATSGHTIGGGVRTGASDSSKPPTASACLSGAGVGGCGWRAGVMAASSAPSRGFGGAYVLALMKSLLPESGKATQRPVGRDRGRSDGHPLGLGEPPVRGGPGEGNFRYPRLT
jgi:hypothetical protein